MIPSENRVHPPPINTLVHLLIGCSLLSSLATAAEPGTMVGVGSDAFGALAAEIDYTLRPLTKVAEGAESVYAGGNVSFYLDGTGRVYGTGTNALSQLNGPQFLDAFSATFKPVIDHISDLGVGTGNSYFIRSDGTLWGLGVNDHGQVLGTNTGSAVTTPREMQTQVVAVAAGTNHVVYLKADGSLWGNGNNSKGQLGQTTGDAFWNPVQIMTDVAAIAAAADHTLILKNDHSLWATGENGSGQLGNASTNLVSTPIQIATNVASMATGHRHSLYVTLDRELWGFGNNQRGQLGPNVHLSSLVPVKLADGVQRVATASDTSLRLTTEGDLYGHGSNDFGHFKSDNRNGSFTPVLIMRGVRSMAPGDQHTVILSEQGEVWTLGEATWGALGDGLSIYHRDPIRSNGGVTRAVASSGITLFLRRDRTLWGVGSNQFGALSSPLTTVNTPVKLADEVIDFSTDGASTLYVTANGELRAQGWNFAGQLGDGTTINRLPAVLVGTEVRNVAMGARSSLILKHDHSLWSFGLNGSGRLGLGTLVNTPTPTWVANDVARIVEGEGHNLFIKSDGTLWGMGSNRFGALGSPDQYETTPVKVADQVIAAATGLFSTFFVKDDGTLWGLGSGAHGQTGRGPYGGISRTPNLIARDVNDVSAGNDHMVYLRQDGTLWGLGSNASGQLGAHGAGPLIEPVLLARQVTSVSAGPHHTVYTQIPEVRLTNLSTRVRIPDTGDGRLVAGFVISGTAPLTALIRAVGPQLAEFDVAGAMPDPSLKIFSADGEVIAINDNWSTENAAEISAVATELGAFALNEGSADAAVMVTLPPGAYTAEVARGDGQPSGVVLLEVYNRHPLSWRSRLVNLSVRTDAGSGEDTLTAGFVVTGDQDAALLVRAVGPTLGEFGVPGFLADPQLTVLNGNTTVATNDDWTNDPQVSAQATEVGAFNLTPSSQDAAIVIDTSPGAYTVQVLTKGDATGNTLVEVYQIDN